ncbi:NADH:flavin oxidoreductase/NADH oxidase [Annulohypoxylon truncatum]|uniref:NADH:flavin oxidoreductase/NADH oxidase n=1 Tax=Annulohypoxylon truncatum TaxID=327061 RepID=UPI002007EACC|nr:NADH:flavin oxidoreductase/NADH oxidase [Annulohypoxylon truncatum]KAI1212142.1 NADH:flavin oxidoreductase/NADH oxidase [Annulohypoxylon truncatum]
MSPKRFHSEGVDPEPLGRPLTFEFSGRTAMNRFMKAAMTERLSTWDPKDFLKRGIPTKELINVYKRWGEGGYGVILTGNTMLEYDQLEAAGNPIIPRDAPFSGERFQRFADLASQAKAHGSLIISQLSHPGRQVSAEIQEHPISASDVQLEGRILGMTFAKPRAMDKKDIQQVIDGFAHAAEYLYKAGFDGIELHGAHGYLIAQYLSPTTNKRTDEYGGSLLNRARIIFEIADEIRKRVNDKKFIVGIKVNSVEFQESGFTTEDCRELCAALEQRSFDFVELSGGTYQQLAFHHKRETTKKREAFFLDFAEKIVPQLTKTKVYVTGGLRTVDAMVNALKTVDGIGLGRPIGNEFDLPKKMLDGRVKSAIEYFDEQDFELTNMATGTQIRLVGKDKEPLDLSRDDHKDVFLKSMQKWAQEMSEDKDHTKYGYVDIEGLKLEPYGTPYASA